MKRNITCLAVVCAMGLGSGAAMAQSAGEYTLGVGFGNVNPKSGNGTLAGGATTINDNTQLTLTAEYFIRDNLGIELLAATPFKHKITIAGVGTATTKHLPPTLSLQYHFANGGNITPFIGAGINYTTFFDEKTTLGNLKIKDSLGLAVNVGLDFKISDRGAIRATVRWMDIDSDVTLGGAKIGTTHIDPVVAGLSYVHRF